MLSFVKVHSGVLSLGYGRGRALGLSHCQRRDETQRNHGAPNCLADMETTPASLILCHPSQNEQYHSMTHAHTLEVETLARTFHAIY
jgi:hypothetical protein